MSSMYKVSSSPHIRDNETTCGIMLDVIIALMPATFFGIYHFGFKAAVLLAVTILASVATEAIYQFFMKRTITIGDFSAALTGLLLGLNLPVGLPIWMAVLGSVFAILIVKQIFGGLGQNFMNPALAARAFLVLSFGTSMTKFTLDSVTQATPLALLKETSTPLNLKEMFIGLTAGTIGEVSSVALLIGALYLIIKRIIDIRIPFALLSSFSIFIIIFSDKPFDLQFLAAHLFGGGLLLGAFFMATDYVTAPITRRGKWLYGAIIGLLTAIFRIYGPSAEGISFAIIFSNLLVPLIEKITVTRGFGRKGKAVN